ncbi:hypothetical protein [Simiduia agarivorans]|uniref:Uncharacterized protein n=1 Tax=Simiduia agarivorans (strain DSM 21679 / JCM 13881 / BCRC 17597 / SA1) TaxID=1117647 RepID=K4KGV7_SIMAS|nr:hypothetical protein [Simiduia agarivorans]AFU98339.1 hypothetical protein M5M_05670 [Simiduia agarivorans SA1 = DSM 21679]
MDGKNQPKTKAELLQELQSIQSLLDEPEDEQFPALDDDDIPLLDEFLLDDGESNPEEDDFNTLLDEAADEALEADTLDALNAAYAALTDDLASEQPEDRDHETATQSTTQSAQNSATPTPRRDAPQNPAQADPQAAAALSDAQQRADEPENSIEPGTRHREGAEAGVTSEHTDPASPAPLPGQQSLFDAPKSAPATSAKEAKPASRPERQPLPQKARGENPFLPQHIRERLRGNQVLPKADFLQPSTPPAHQDLPAMVAEKPPESPKAPLAAETAVSIDTEPDLSPLVDQLVAEILPTVEARLRELIAERLTKDPHDH